MALQLHSLQPDLHDTTGFSCGEARIDAFLQQRAAQHSRDGLSTTHVLLDPAHGTPAPVIGFYTLAPATLQVVDAAPLAAVRIVQLAVAIDHQGRGHGQLLLAAAVERCLQMRDSLQVRALVADVIGAKAGRFYRQYGLRSTSAHAATLYLALPANA